MSRLGGVLKRSAVQVDLDHVAARRFHGLLNGSRHFAGLAATETNTTLTITNYSQRGEGEDTTTLHGFATRLT